MWLSWALMDASARAGWSRPAGAPSPGNACGWWGPRNLPGSALLNSPEARNNGCLSPAPSTQPEVLMLDEPTAGVDPEATHAVLDFISRIIEERKITVLLVTHDYALVRHHAEQ